MSYFTIPATINGNQVTFTITDGQKGDVDAMADGTITDPGGPGLAGADPTIIPTLGEYALMAVAGLLTLGAAGLMKAPASVQRPRGLSDLSRFRGPAPPTVQAIWLSTLPWAVLALAAAP